jgi:hypothetical protein
MKSIFSMLFLSLLVSASAGVGFAEDLVLKNLGEKYVAQQSKYAEAIRAASSEEERESLVRKMDPRQVFVQDFLEIESKHRGQSAAISALYRLIENAKGITETELPAWQGRVKAIAVAREHYLKHEDLDLLLTSFESGAYTAEAEHLLRDAAVSPHERVRAAGKYWLGRFLEYKAAGAQRAQQFRDRPGTETDATRSYYETFLVGGPVDVKHTRQEAIAFAKQVIDDFADVLRVRPRLAAD